MTRPAAFGRIRNWRSGMRWVWYLGGLSVRELVRRVVAEISNDDLLGRAAQLSFYFLFALFPSLIFISAILGHVFETNTDLYRDLMDHLSSVMPPSAFDLVRGTLEEIRSGATGRKVSLGLLATLWAASSGMQSVIDGLNIAYDVTERRPWWRRRAVATVLTVVLTAVSVITLALSLFGHRIGRLLANTFGLGDAFGTLWFLLRFFITPVFLVIVFTIIYRYAPNVRHRGWQALMPGALVGAGVWFAAAGLFRLYLRYFDTYGKTYGSLGAVIVLMMWLYVAAMALLLGGEINSEIRKAAAEAGAPAAQGIQGDAGNASRSGSIPFGGAE